MAGWTLALDFPARTPGLAGLLGSLDRLVVEAGGRVYLAKDSRVPPDVLAEMYPRLAEFRKLRAELDPAGHPRLRPVPPPRPLAPPRAVVAHPQTCIRQVEASTIRSGFTGGFLGFGTTGRTLRTGVPPRSHSEDELISSWADDQIAIP